MNYSRLIGKLDNESLTTIVPMYRSDHWMTVVHKHDCNKWKVYYLDSIKIYSEQ